MASGIKNMETKNKLRKWQHNKMETTKFRNSESDGNIYYTNFKKRRTFVFADKTDLKSTKKFLQKE